MQEGSIAASKKSIGVNENINSFTKPWVHITLILNIAFFILNYYNRVFPIGLNVCTNLIAISFYFIYYSKFNKHLNFFLFFFYVLWISFYTTISHYDTFMVVYFIVLFSLSVTLFQQKKIRMIMTTIAVLAFVTVISIKPLFEDIIVYDDNWRKLLHITIASFALMYAIYKFALDADSESSKKDGLIKKVKEKNIELERFAYITSHDLKQPVRNIVAFTELLERSVMADNKKEKNKEYLKYIKSSSESLEKLIDDILRLSRIGEQDFINEKVDTTGILDKILTSLKVYIESNNASVTFDDFPTIQGNKIYLTLVLQNLIENGIKYNKSAEPKVHLAYLDQNNNHVISVEDNGLGIDKKYFNLIFQPFKRLHDNSEFKGSGLGLSICKRILELMGGTITVESESGKGTKFNLLIPKSISS